MAAQRWPTPWREALGIALDRGLVFGTPLVHSWPNRMTRGRVALAGDAAHAASPMVGGGFRQGLFDVAALSAVMDAGRDLQIANVLDAYEQRRLSAARAHVEQSLATTQRYLERRGLG